MSVSQQVSISFSQNKQMLTLSFIHIKLYINNKQLGMQIFFGLLIKTANNKTAKSYQLNKKVTLYLPIKPY